MEASNNCIWCIHFVIKEIILIQINLQKRAYIKLEATKYVQAFNSFVHNFTIPGKWIKKNVQRFVKIVRIILFNKENKYGNVQGAIHLLTHKTNSNPQ